MMGAGPRASPEEAARNQRERLYGAMVACCAERGYEPTTVSDLTALSGVSRRDFYRHFADRTACFEATLGALLARAHPIVAAPGEDFRLRLEALLGAAGDQTPAACFCLTEPYPAGPGAVARLDAAMEDAAAGLRLRLPGAEGLPAEAYPALVAGIREVAHGFLERGRAEELAALAEPLWEWVSAYEPPPAPLPRPRPDPGSAGRYLPDDPAERIIGAFVSCVAEHGFQATTIGAVVARAGVSFSTFYSHFDSKQAVMAATLDGGQARLIGVALPRYRRGRDWPSSVRSAFEAMFALFAAEPDFARVAMVEVFAAGGASLKRRERTIKAMGSFIEPGFELRPELPRLIAEAIGGATYNLVYEQIRRKGAERVPELAPLATYLTLAPFLGAEEAAAAARGRKLTGP
jgi:AcrR family transcriptional regulator